MTIRLDGLGDDWVVTRGPGGKPELSSFSSPEELLAVLHRMLAKAQMSPALLRGRVQSESPAVRLPIAAPVPAPATATPTNGAQTFDAEWTENCQTCGACCVATDQGRAQFAKIEVEDCDNLPKVMRSALTVAAGNKIFLKTKVNPQGVRVCSALSGAVGESCKCGVYTKRPMICRLFEPGAEGCLKAREAHLSVQRR